MVAVIVFGLFFIPWVWNFVHPFAALGLIGVFAYLFVVFFKRYLKKNNES